MTMLGPFDGPGLVHADTEGNQGAVHAIVDLGFILFGVTNGTVLAAKSFGASGNGYTVTVTADRPNDGSCTISEAGTALTIHYDNNPDVLNPSGTTSATVETALASSTLFTVLHADATSTRDWHNGGANFSGTRMTSINGYNATGNAGDAAVQVDDGGTTNPLAAYASFAPQPRVVFWDTNIGNGTSAPFSVANGGTGAAGSFTISDDQHPMSRQYITGTTSTGRWGLIWNTPAVFDTAGHQWRYECRFQIPTLSNATDQFNFTAGFTDVLTAIDAVDGAYIKIDSQAAANFQCVTSANSVRTTTDSGIAAVAGTWYRVVIIVTNVTKVDFYIYAEGSSFPSSPTATITTNIPTGTTRASAVGAGVLKSVGTTSRGVFVQYQLTAHDRLAA